MNCSKFHTPAPITKEEFQIGGLKPLSCSIESISDAIVEFLRPLHGSKSQGATPPSNDTTTSTLSRRDRAIQRFRNRGTERDLRFRIEKPWSLLTIKRQEVSDFSSLIGSILLKDYLEILLHEMSHAMFDLYTCRCFHGCYQTGGQRFTMICPGRRSRKPSSLWNWNGPEFRDMRRETCLANDMQLGYTLFNDAVLHSANEAGKSRCHKARQSQSMTPWYPLKFNRCSAGQSTVDEYGRDFGYDRARWTNRKLTEPGSCTIEQRRYRFMQKTKQGRYYDDATDNDWRVYLGFMDYQPLPGFKSF
ncbi:hypothetical protein DL98DRAFT_532761 [Cadophora sp. DSE1049]|nr:hypothetical protein DL98DRAFT_532761 [Cadophora sp. DSE1049]